VTDVYAAVEAIARDVSIATPRSVTWSKGAGRRTTLGGIQVPDGSAEAEGAAEALGTADGALSDKEVE